VCFWQVVHSLLLSMHLNCLQLRQRTLCPRNASSVITEQFLHIKQEGFSYSIQEELITRKTRDSWSRPQGSMTRTFCCYGDTYYIISTTILRFSSTCAKITGVHRKVCKVLVCSGQVVHSPLLSVHLMPAAEAEDVVPVRRVFSDDRAVSAYHGRGVLVV